jgi:polysaccharide export outer membrane protein
MMLISYIFKKRYALNSYSELLRCVSQKGFFLATLLMASVLFSPVPGQQSPDRPEEALKKDATNAAQSTQVAEAMRGEPERDNRYRIGPGDVLDIRILNRANLSRDAVRVEGNGMIRMPLVEEEIQAACHTEGELAQEIAERYTKFYRRPQVDVFIKEYHANQVAIIGAVNDQSRFELQRRVRLLELLTYAKGPSPKAGQRINIVHSPPPLSCSSSIDAAASSLSSYKLSDTLAGLAEANPYLLPGDIVTLPEADQVYVVGNVYSPMTIPLKEPITLARAIAMAGGVRQDSKKDKVRIVRQDPGSATKRELTVDLSAIEKKRAEDIALVANDIIDVPTSAGKSLLRSLLGSVAPAAAQLPVRVIP